MGKADDFLHGHAETIHETYVGQGNDEGVPIDERFVVSWRETVALRFHEHDLSAARLLGHPDVPHSGELEFAQYNFPPVAE